MATILTLAGKTNDLLHISESNGMKMTRLFYLNPESQEECEEVLDVAITSTNCKGCHPIFDQLLGKKIKITIETEEDVQNPQPAS